MANPPLSSAPLVTNTDPAQLPGAEPLIGKHVSLIQFEEDHFSDLWQAIGAHPELWTWWPDGPFDTPTAFNANMNELLSFVKTNEDLIVWSVFPLSGAKTGQAVGLAFGLSEDRSTNRVGEFGLFFGPDLRRTRAGTEVTYLVCDLLFKLNHRKVGWKTNSFNLESRRAAERYGFVLDGIMRQDKVQKGRSRDTAVYSILDGEWSICKEAFKTWLSDENFNASGFQKKRLEEIRDSLK